MKGRDLISLLRAVILVGALFCAASVNSWAQVTDGSSDFHVFPRIADGQSSNGISMSSTLMVSNPWSSRASCVLRLYGMQITFGGRLINGQSERFVFRSTDTTGMRPKVRLQHN